MSRMRRSFLLGSSSSTCSLMCRQPWQVARLEGVAPAVTLPAISSPAI